ncbi:mycothiol synthase [Nocardioides sp. Bht2]|uniref:mycothiol synthase n=1 Tax=Nocardioides sp. Bht2 TaxID=3392297 RepID=UPI0039B4CC2A
MIDEIRAWDIEVRDQVIDLVRACREVDGHSPLDEAAVLRLKNRGLTGSRLWLADRAGFALLHDGGLELAVAPEHRGSGLGTALASAAVEEARTAWSHGDHPAAAALAQRFGFARARELWVMRRPVGAEPALSGEIGIRAYTDADRDELLRVNAEAFASHPEQGAMDADNLAERMSEPWFDPAGLLVVADGERMLGFHWTKQHSPEVGEVYVVGTDPAAQGRGLGKALTIAGLRHLAGVLDADGEVILYVESDNTPARRLYESLGFTHVAADTHVQYRR